MQSVGSNSQPPTVLEKSIGQVVWDVLAELAYEFFKMIACVFCCTDLSDRNVAPVPPNPNVPTPTPTPPNPAPRPPVTPNLAPPPTPQLRPYVPEICETQMQNWFEEYENPFTQESPCNPFEADLSSGNIFAYPGDCTCLGLPIHPCVGKYGQGYPVANNHVIIKLPKHQLSAFPLAIQHEFANIPEDKLNLYVMVQSDPHMNSGSEKRNILFSTMAFPDIAEGGTKIGHFKMGVFDGESLRTSSQSSDLMPVNRFGVQSIHLHPAGNSMAISPDNARVFVDKTKDTSSFFAASHLPDGKACAFFTIIAHKSQLNIEGNLNGSNPKKFVHSIIKSPHVTEGDKQKIQKLFTLEISK